MRHVLLALSLWLLPGTATAGTVGVLLADDGTPTQQDLTRIAAGTGEPASSLVVMERPEDAPWSSTVRLEPCTSGAIAVDLGALVVSARAQVANLAAEEAQVALDDALRTLPCSAEPVPHADLALALEVAGEAAQVAGSEGNARFAYEALLAVDSGYSLTSAAGTGYEELFNEVRRTFGAQPEARLGLWHAGEAWWNGAPVRAQSGAALGALPGRHLLQWRAGGAVAGAWVVVPEGGDALSLVAADAVTGLLGGGLTGAGSRAAIEPLLDGWAQDAGHDGIVVLAETGADAGYIVRQGAATTWAAPASALSAATTPDRLRVTVGGGYANIQLAHYGDLAVAADVRLLGPLHVRVEGDLAISQPIAAVTGFGGEGKAAVLPGLGVGVAVRPTRGIIQPFAALTLGAWFGALDAGARDELEAALAASPGAPGISEQDLALIEARHPVDFRGFIDGGVDLLPGGGRLVVRVSAGVGLGLALTPEAPVGFQMRVGASAGFRFGLEKRPATP